MIAAPKTIEEIIQFSCLISEMLGDGKRIITTETERQLNKCLNNLQTISKSSLRTSEQEKMLIPQAFNLFHSIKVITADSLSHHFHTRRLKRTLSYAIAYSSANNSKQAIFSCESFPNVIEFLRLNWHTGMLLGLFNCVILHWKSMPARHSIMLRERIRDSIIGYAGKRHDLLNIKKNISKYCEHNGPATWAGSMVGNREAPGALFKVHGLQNLYKHSEYCTCFITAFVLNACRAADFDTFIDDIAEFLSDFQDKATSQLCFAYLAIRADKDSGEVFKQRLLSYAIRIAGDPAKTSKWVPSRTFSEQEKDDYEKGTVILNRWINLKFIDLFFEKVSMDRERKKFWQKYYKSIDRIKILGDDQVKFKFQRDERVRDFIDSRFGTLSYGCSALLMQVNDYVLLEFGGTGNAFYAYKRNAKKCPKFDNNSYSVYSLKDTSMSYLNDALSQGRLVHRNGWQMELSRWLTLHVGIRNDQLSN